MQQQPSNSQLPVIISAPTAPEILTHEMNSARWTLKALGVVNVFAGITLLASCWAVYYYAIFLGFLALIFGGIQVRHTETETAVFRFNSAFITPNTLFRKLTFLNVLLVVNGAIGVLVAAIATERRSLCGDAFCFLVRADFYFAIFGLLASIAVTVSGLVSVYLSRGLERELNAAFGMPIGQPTSSMSDPNVPQTKYVPFVADVPRGNPNIVFSETPVPHGYGTSS